MKSNCIQIYINYYFLAFHADLSQFHAMKNESSVVLKDCNVTNNVLEIEEENKVSPSSITSSTSSSSSTTTTTVKTLPDNSLEFQSSTAITSRTTALHDNLPEFHTSTDGDLNSEILCSKKRINCNFW